MVNNSFTAPKFLTKVRNTVLSKVSKKVSKKVKRDKQIKRQTAGEGGEFENPGEDQNQDDSTDESSSSELVQLILFILDAYISIDQFNETEEYLTDGQVQDLQKYIGAFIGK